MVELLLRVEHFNFCSFCADPPSTVNLSNVIVLSYAYTTSIPQVQSNVKRYFVFLKYIF